MIHGIGTDIVDVSRMEKIISRWGMRFLEKVFTKGEIEYCSKKAYPAPHYAGRFAAKESVLKSLGLGLGSELRLRDIEVLNHQKGQPYLHRTENMQKALQKRGIRDVHISITHTKLYAHAIVIMEK